MLYNSRYRLAEKIYLSLYITSLMLVGIFMMTTTNYSGELSSFEYLVSSSELTIILGYSVLGFIAAYFFYIITKDKRIAFSFSPFRVNILRLNIVFGGLLIAQLFFLVLTGVGRIGSQATNPFSPLFALLNIDGLFTIFYMLVRKSPCGNRTLFWFTVTIYVIYKLLQGWSGVFLTIFFMELYFYFQSHTFKFWNRIFMVILLPLFILLIGGKIYHYVFPYKLEVRGMGMSQVSYSESVVNLTNRLTFFPVAVGAYEKDLEIQHLAFQDGTFLREIKGFFRPFTPRFLMDDKDFRSINNLVMQSFFPSIEGSTSSDIGLIMYVYTLFKLNVGETIVWLVFTFMLLLFNKAIIDAFEQYKGQLNFIYFLLIMKLYYTASPEMVFGYGSISILFLLPLLFATGSIKFKR
ncbi:oligosaccharide repeat unit polymerase [Geotalea daltonii]|nr:oligosaccharide repeat unit polymerase [Geotalea daltonii]